MKKTIELTKQHFESSSYRTPQYLEWHRTFRRELTKVLRALGATEIDIRKPNHFDASGFFRAPRGQVFYFSVSDLRFFKTDMLIRTAKSFSDYTGGTNQYIKLDNEIDFIARLNQIIA